ncbi:hypothetical protein BTVI_143056 [Pitangus sulphuratus]|nr:hypothetical protein BTVI_143056 [Pitangus sulphuratus]
MWESGVKEVLGRLATELGGPDPLDYVSMYRNLGNPALNVPEHWHYVSFGLSDLYGDNRVHDLTLGCGDQERCLKTGIKGKKEDPGSCESVSLTSIPGKVMEPPIREAISIHREDKKVIRNSQHEFTKGKSGLTNLAFYNETTTWMSEGRAVDIVCLNLSKAFNTVSHNILIGKLRMCGLDEWTVKWIENWLKSRSQRAIISGTGISWRPVTSGVPQYCLTSPSMTWMKQSMPPQPIHL